MQVYKIELLIIDHDGLGAEGIREVLEDTRYPNHCIMPKVKSIEGKDIGEWTDEHPLNKRSTADAAYKEIFQQVDTAKDQHANENLADYLLRTAPPQWDYRRVLQLASKMAKGQA